MHVDRNEMIIYLLCLNDDGLPVCGISCWFSLDTSWNSESCGWNKVTSITFKASRKSVPSKRKNITFSFRRFGLRAASCVDCAFPETGFKTLIYRSDLVDHGAPLTLRVNEPNQHETKAFCPVRIPHFGVLGIGKSQIISSNTNSFCHSMF